MLRPLLFRETVKNNSFWSDVFKAYGIFFRKMKLNSASQLLSEPVLCKKNMIIANNKVIKHTQWVDDGVYCVAQFIKKMGSSYSWEIFIYYLCSI